MAAIVWDAGNILQVTQSTDGYRGGTQCVGRAPSRNNNRCGWTIRDRYSEIRDLLRVISGTQPGLVTTETLSKLAKLCLCPDWHWNQKDEVVARWKSVVRAEAQRYNAASNNPTPAELQSAIMESVSQIQTTLTQAQKKLAEKEALILAVRRDLETERLSLQQFRRKAAESENRLRLELSDWRNRFESSQDDKRSQEVAISKIKTSNEALEAEIKRLFAEWEQDKKELDAERLSSFQFRQNATETENQLRLEVSTWKDRLQSSQDDKRSHEITITQIQSSNEDLEAEVKKLLAERKQGEKELEAEKLSLVRFRQDAAESERRLRLELSDWKNRFEASQEGKESQETTNETLELEINKLRADRERGEKEISALQGMVEKAKALLEESKTEILRDREESRALNLDLARIRNAQADVADDLKKLHIELTTSTDLNKELTAKLDERDESLRQGRENLERERARIADLEANIARLEISEKDLKASISACWWHRSWMRLVGPHKGRSSKRGKETLPSTSAISHSTTTNVLYK